MVMVTVNVAKESPDRVLSELQKLDYPKEKIHLSIVNAVCTLIFNISKSNYISMVLPLLPLVGKGIRRLGQKLFSNTTDISSVPSNWFIAWKPLIQ